MIIGILGEAGSGKDAAGVTLVEHYGYYSLALADPLKLFCQWMFGWTPAQLWGPSELRNVEDENYPFQRCPSCGFHWPDTAEAVIEEEAQGVSVYSCPICDSRRDPREWLGHLSPRFALQDLGTEWARYLNASCHIDFALNRATIVLKRGAHFDPLWHNLPTSILQTRLKRTGISLVNGVYISDCRFCNEVRLIQGAGGKVFRIYRDQRKDTTTTGMPNHASELEQRGIADSELDGIIHNHGTLEQLQEAVRSLVADL